MITSDFGYIIATDYVPADGKTDVSDALQKLIDNNPNRTIFFPDGIYLLSKPILTPAHPERSVSLKLSDFAVLKASPDWTEKEAVVRLGASHPANDIYTIGSNYSFSGGVVDGSDLADGISIDGGRETVVRDVSIKHTRIGIHIKRGANSGSSDADISGVNIIGTGKTDSVGVLLEGYDNTLTNMRIAKVFIGVHLCSAGNSLRNIHPLYTCDYTDYQSSCGFRDEAGNNWYDYAYSDHFGIGYSFARGASSTVTNGFAWWYSTGGGRHAAIQCDGAFDSIVTNLKIGFCGSETDNPVLVELDAPGKGRGVFDRLAVNLREVTGNAHLRYLQNGIIPQ